jgi:hypothetical protein
VSKKARHVLVANEIGNDSYELINFNQLPKSASAERQISALEADKEWQRSHHDETIRAIDRLIQEIRGY